MDDIVININILNKVVKINSGSTVLDLAKNALDKERFEECIKYCHRFLKGESDHKDALNAQLFLAQSYMNLHLFDLSNYYLFNVLSYGNDEATQLAYCWLGTNFMYLNDYTLAKYYFNKCLDIDENNEISVKVKEQIRRIDTKYQKKFKVIGGDEEKISGKDLRIGEKLLASGKFERAIEQFENMDFKKAPKAKTSLALCYFLLGDSERAIDITNEGEKSLLDYCNLAIFYDSLLKEDKVEEIIDYMTSHATNNLEEIFKMGITFSQIGRHKLAMKYLGKYVNVITNDPQSLLLFSIACLNCDEIEEARKSLISCQTLDVFNAFLYKTYLNYCNGKKPKHISYMFEIQPFEYIEINKKIKDWIIFDDAKFKKVVLNNLDMFYWMLKTRSVPSRNLILSRMATIKDKSVDKFFDMMLLDYTIPKGTKFLLLNKRLGLLKYYRYAVVVDNIYSTFSGQGWSFSEGPLPSRFVESYTLAQMYLVEKNLGRDVTIKANKFFFNNYCLQEEQPNNYITAALLIWLFCEDKKIITVKQLCKDMLIEEAEFFKWEKILIQGIIET